MLLVPKRERVTASYVRRLVRVGFLAPTIVEAIVDGRQPEDLTRYRAHDAARSPDIVAGAGAGARYWLAHACRSFSGWLARRSLDKATEVLKYRLF